MTPGTDVKQWHGITVSGGKLVSLNLMSNDLEVSPALVVGENGVCTISSQIDYWELIILQAATKRSGQGGRWCTSFLCMNEFFRKIQIKSGLHWPAVKNLNCICCCCCFLSTELKQYIEDVH